MKQISLSAKNYANALIQIGIENIVSFEDILNDLHVIETICASSPELVDTMKNPTISSDTKISIATEIFQTQVNEKIQNFMKILIEKKKFNELEEIISAYKIKMDEINNIKSVEIISAIELNEDKKRIIIEKLTRKLNKKINPNWIIDSKIIGGLVIKIDDDIIDTSLKNKLQDLSKNIRA